MLKFYENEIKIFSGESLKSIFRFFKVFDETLSIIIKFDEDFL